MMYGLPWITRMPIFCHSQQKIIFHCNPYIVVHCKPYIIRYILSTVGQLCSSVVNISFRFAFGNYAPHIKRGWFELWVGDQLTIWLRLTTLLALCWQFYRLHYETGKFGLSHIQVCLPITTYRQHLFQDTRLAIHPLSPEWINAQQSVSFYVSMQKGVLLLICAVSVSA